jgi:hypothetical protein
VGGSAGDGPVAMRRAGEGVGAGADSSRELRRRAAVICGEARTGNRGGGPVHGLIW